MPVVGADTHQTLTGVASGDVEPARRGCWDCARRGDGIDRIGRAHVRAGEDRGAEVARWRRRRPTSWQVGNALNDGASPEDILAVLKAVAPQVGGPKVVAAAPEIMLALGLTLPDDV